MPQGLQCFNASGSLVLDVTDRLTRILGEFTAGGSDGSLSDANLSTGSPWYVLKNDNANQFNLITDSPIAITLSSSGISWTYGAYGLRKSFTYIYGVY